MRVRWRIGEMLNNIYKGVQTTSVNLSEYGGRHLTEYKQWLSFEARAKSGSKADFHSMSGYTLSGIGCENRYKLEWLRGYGGWNHEYPHPLFM